MSGAHKHASRGGTGPHANRLHAIVCDIGDVDAVNTAGEAILKALGSVEVLVNAAGTNAPNRALEILSLADYHAMMNTNLHGAYYCTQAFLPQMRSRGLHSTRIESPVDLRNAPIASF